MSGLKKRVMRLRRQAVFFVARWFVRLCGFDNSRPLGTFFSALQYHLFVFNRRRCLAHLGSVLGRSPHDPGVAKVLRSAYRVNTITALEVVSMADRKIDTGRLYERCKVDGIENLAEARTGRGAILLATHAGNSLMLLAQLADKGWPMTVVYRRSPNMPQQFFDDGLRHYGFEGIASNDGFRAFAGMVDAVRHNRVVFAMMDDAAKKVSGGVQHRFLGKDMQMPGGIVQLARQARAPIVPVSSLAVDPVWHFRIEPQLRLAPGGSVEEDVAVVLGHVERQILAHPELWSWPHRRWCKYPLPTGA